MWFSLNWKDGSLAKPKMSTISECCSCRIRLHPAVGSRTASCPVFCQQVTCVYRLIVHIRMWKLHKQGRCAWPIHCSNVPYCSNMAKAGLKNHINNIGSHNSCSSDAVYLKNLILISGASFRKGLERSPLINFVRVYIRPWLEAYFLCMWSSPCSVHMHVCVEVWHNNCELKSCCFPAVTHKSWLIIKVPFWPDRANLSSYFT